VAGAAWVRSELPSSSQALALEQLLLLCTCRIRQHTSAFAYACSPPMSHHLPHLQVRDANKISHSQTLS
jgi:hypothetical protein